METGGKKMETNKLKELLNNLTLLKWVKKFKADGLLEDNKMATEKFKVKPNKDSISILDKTSTKLLITNAEFDGEELVKFNLKQLNDLLEVVGKEGEFIIPKNSQMNEMIAKVNNDIIVVCPLPKTDKKKK
jgi:hypothetical protein